MGSSCFLPHTPREVMALASVEPQLIPAAIPARPLLLVVHGRMGGELPAELVALAA